MRVLKFGGTSVGSAESLGHVCDIVAGTAPCTVVVSALSGVTDGLLGLAHSAAGNGAVDQEALDGLIQRHHETARAVVAPDELEEVLVEIDAEFARLAEVVRGIALVGEASRRTMDQVSATGELLSSRLVAAALRRHGTPAQALDAREVLVTDGRFGAARCDEEASFPKIAAWFRDHPGTAVVTGFIARGPGGDTTTLGRGGSDTSAALFAAALGAEALEIWTDVDGVMSADPRVVPDAVPVPRLSYEELMELSHFGAKVVHPPTVHPARAHRIPLRIRNTFRPDAPGTLVLNEGMDDEPREGPVCGITSIPDVALLSLEGDGMIGVPGIAGRLFASLARRAVNVILISQASSEHSICLAVRPDDVAAARTAVDEEFAAERAAGMVRPLVVEGNQTVLAVVGAGMRDQPGIAGRLFRGLGARGVNVRAIAQGSSELNVSLVVAGRDETRALNALHEEFFLLGHRTAHVALAGVGGVGSALLEQLAAQRDPLAADHGVRVRLVAACNSRRTVHDPRGLDPARVHDALARAEDDSALAGLVGRICESRAARRVFVDTTASDETGEQYERLLRAGVSVVTANKRRLAGGWSDYERLRDAGPGRIYHETTVGAGLPVVRPLADLRATGDRLLRLDGVLSGTSSALLADLETGHSLSDAVRRAHDRGFTEPDPRDDLTGQDVARKLLILGRLAGLPLEPEDVAVTPLLPDEPWGPMDLDTFWARLPEVDEEFAERQREAAAGGRRLRYLARIENGKASVGLVPVDADHPCYDMRSGQNLVAMFTERYAEDPLVVRGPGAGRGVTAAGVFADILRAVAEAPGERT